MRREGGPQGRGQRPRPCGGFFWGKVRKREEKWESWEKVLKPGGLVQLGAVGRGVLAGTARTVVKLINNLQK